MPKDWEGHPRYPSLYGLYQHVDTGGCEIQIELSTQKATMCAAGFCRIEHHTEGVPKDVVLIMLNLGTIDRAIPSDEARRAGGFIPFACLGKKERCAEVLGHELAHVARLLTDPDYRRLYLERQTLADTGSEDLRLIGKLTRLIEHPAEAAEVEIWRELTAGRQAKMGQSVWMPR